MSAITTRFLAFFAPVFASSQQASQEQVQPEQMVFEFGSMKAVVPPCPLASGSIQIMSRGEISQYSAWDDKKNEETYTLIQKIVRVWAEKGIHDYMIIGKETENPRDSFHWEVVPYPKSMWRFWEQFKVLWKTTFGASCTSASERERIAKELKEHPAAAESLQRSNEDKVAQGKDPFCDPEKFKKQVVFEGKWVRVLYDYRPIGQEKLHFLVVPKLHKEKFSDLSREEYLEASTLSEKLVSYYKQQGVSTAYIYNKTGKEAGQTVPHWHQHLVFTATKTQELFGKLMVLKNMVIGSSPLSPDELRQRVEKHKRELADVLK